MPRRRVYKGKEALQGRDQREIKRERNRKVNSVLLDKIKVKHI